MKRAYLRFCLHFSQTPVPATKESIVLYTVFLARSLTPASIPGYLNIVKLMHLERGLPDPLDSWELQTVKKGIKCTLGRPPRQKLPLTPELLHRIHHHLNHQDSQDKAFGAACLIAFFAFLRKSTLLPKSVSQKDISKALCVKDLQILPSDSMLTLHIRHTKTIQFGQRNLEIPIAAIPNSVLCPVTAVTTMLSDITPGSISGDHPLFSFKSSNGDNPISCLTYSSFIRKLKSTLMQCGLDSDHYSGHSFRRGGCTYAFRLGVSPMLIKLRGDWRSNAFERYIFIQADQHISFAKTLAMSLK